MKPLTREWVDKAEADYRSMRWEMKAPDPVNYDAVCFHAQQCCEKLVKALLQEAGIAFRKTHDLGELLELAISVNPLCSALRDDAHPLSAYAVEFRYPGMSASEHDAKNAIQLAERIRSVIHRALAEE